MGSIKEELDNLCEEILGKSFLEHMKEGVSDEGKVLNLNAHASIIERELMWLRQVHKASEDFEKAWMNSLEPWVLSHTVIVMTLVDAPVSYGSLLKKTKVASETLNKHLKKLIKLGEVRKEIIRKFPKETRYSFEPEALESFKPIANIFHQTKKSMNTLIALSYTKGATTEDIVELGLKKVESTYSWLLSRLIDRDEQWGHLIMLVTQAMTFWGIIYALRAPHRKDEAKRILDLYQITLGESFIRTIQGHKQRFLK